MQFSHPFPLIHSYRLLLASAPAPAPAPAPATSTTAKRHVIPARLLILVKLEHVGREAKGLEEAVAELGTSYESANSQPPWNHHSSPINHQSVPPRVRKETSETERKREQGHRLNRNEKTRLLTSFNFPTISPISCSRAAVIRVGRLASWERTKERSLCARGESLLELGVDAEEEGLEAASSVL